MTSGFIFNAFICLIIFLSAFLVGLGIIKNNKEKVDKFFGLFWFLASFTWLFVAVGLYIFSKELFDLDLYLNKYLIQTTVYLQLSAGIYYGAHRLFKKEKIAFGFLFVYLITSLFSLYFAYQAGGVVLREATFFSIEYIINPVSDIFFQILAFTGIFFILIDSIKLLIIWLKNRNFSEKRYLMASSSIVFYGIVGYFDNQGYTATWLVVFFRLIMLFSVLLAYLAYSHQEEL